MTEEEFGERQNGVIEPEDLEAMRNDAFLSEDNVPEEIDWVARGAVTTPRSQGACGSCWAFATVATIESANQIYTGELLDLSEQELVDCDEKDGGCKGAVSAVCLLPVDMHQLRKYRGHLGQIERILTFSYLPNIPCICRMGCGPPCWFHMLSQRSVVTMPFVRDPVLPC